MDEFIVFLDCLRQGRELKGIELAKCKELLANDESQLCNRLKLIAYYSKSKSRHKKLSSLLGWLIETEPANHFRGADEHKHIAMKDVSAKMRLYCQR